MFLSVVRAGCGRRSLITSASGVVLIGLALIGSRARAATPNVLIVNFAYQPATLIVAAGETVTWTASMANGITPHTATSDAAVPVWDSGTLTAGQSFAFTFATPGDYPFHCMYHPLAMQGTIHVVGKQRVYLPVVQR